MSEQVPSKIQLIDYLDHPPQRYAHTSGSLVEAATGSWVKFEDMDLYMFEGAQLMQQLNAENDRLTENAGALKSELDHCAQMNERLRAELADAHEIIRADVATQEALRLRGALLTIRDCPTYFAEKVLAEVPAVETTVCQHHWEVVGGEGSPDGPTYHDECKRCGAKRVRHDLLCFFCSCTLEEHGNSVKRHPWREGSSVTLADLKRADEPTRELWIRSNEYAYKLLTHIEPQ